ncbi:FkbM family methyltransferase [Brevundimonas sp.]|uniref:FkbM family methyltransferase n=1 Tax=Brevundimonas sp. TaxID=1871086 RepID=UPI00289A64EC|nr:FkbM family methyltransferase [Brevundimonas sp.]
MRGSIKSDTRLAAVRAALTSFRAEQSLFSPVVLGDFMEFKPGRLRGIFLREGWSDVEADGVWSLGKRATVDLICPPSVGVEAVVAIAFKAFVTAERPQRVEITAGGESLTVVRIPPGDHRLHIVYQSVPVQDGRVSLTLCLPDACSPKSISVGDDTRELAVKLTSLRVLAPSRDCVVEAAPDVVYHGVSVFSPAPVKGGDDLAYGRPSAHEEAYRPEEDHDAIDLDLSEAVGLGFAALGFWAEEAEGRWTRSCEARLILPLDGLASAKGKLDVYLSLRPYAPLARGQSIVISVMNRSIKYRFSQGDGNRYLVCLPGVRRGSNSTLTILIQTESLTSPHSLAGEGDPRIIGVQVSRARVQSARHGLPSWSRHHKIARPRPSILHSMRAKWDRRLHQSGDTIGNEVSSIVEHLDRRLLAVSDKMTHAGESNSLIHRELAESIDGVRRGSLMLCEDLYSRISSDIAVSIGNIKGIQDDVRTIQDRVGILGAQQQEARLALSGISNEIRDLRSYASIDLQKAIVLAVSKLFEESKAIHSQALQASSDRIVRDVSEYGRQAVVSLLDESQSRQEASLNSLLDSIIAGFSNHSQSTAAHLLDESQVRHEEILKGLLGRFLDEISAHTNQSVSAILEDARGRQSESFKDLSGEIQKAVAQHREQLERRDELAQITVDQLIAEFNDLKIHETQIQSLVEGLHSKVDTTVRRHSIRYNEATEAIRTDYGYVLVPSHDLPLILHILSTPIYGYEWGTAQVMKTVVAEGMRVADVGANVGMHALLLARLVGEEGKVYAVEPLADLAANLKLAMALNGFHGRASVINVAAGDAAGHALINRGLTSSHSSFFPLDDALMAGSEMVELATLDDAIPGRVDFLKIDAEGYELNIVQGASRHLSNPDIVVVAEFANSHVGRAGGDSEAWFAAMHREGFSCFLIAAEPGGNVLSPLADVAFFEDGNYLMVRRGSRHWSSLISLSSAALQ